jgi:hypothetical protein
MDIPNILGTIAKAKNKRKGDLTRSYNAAFKKATAKFEGTGIPEDAIQKVALTEVAEKYEVLKSELDAIIDMNGDIEEFKMEDNEVFEEEEVVVATKAKVPKSGSLSKKAWAAFFKDNTRDIDYEKTPPLEIKIGGTYTLSLLDPSKQPYKYDGIGISGEPYSSFAIEVKLHKAYPEDLYDEVYPKGELKGQYCYDDDKHYTLWLNKTALGYFEKFFDGEPDDRIFTYKRTGTGRNTKYNFADPKTAATKRRR